MPRTLVIQLGRLGDVVQTTPLIHELAQSGDIVDLLVLTPNETAVCGLRGLTTIFTISEELKSLDDAIARNFSRGEIPAEAPELLTALRLPSYDRIINASHAPLGCWLAAEIPCATGERFGGLILDGECLYRGAASAYRVAMLQFREQNQFNLVDLLRCARGGTAGQAHARPRLYATRSADIPFALPPGLRVALNPGANEKTRCWPAANFARLAEALAAVGFVPLLVGAPGDRLACEQVQAACGVALQNFAGRTTIPEMATLLARCELLVSGDTGAAHLGAAAGTTVVGLYGASAYFAETAPYGEGHLILQTAIGAPMRAISPEIVLAATLNRLGRIASADLRRELARHNQAAWETRFLEVEVDPLGGLCYHPLHREASSAGDLLARALRHAFAHEFSDERSRVSLAANFSAERSFPENLSELTEILQKAETLARILGQMHSAARLCGENANSGREARWRPEITSTASTLICSLEEMKKLVATPEWRALAPVIHYLDWRVRMLPQLPPHETFLVHGDEYATAAQMLRDASTTANSRSSASVSSQCDFAYGRTAARWPSKMAPRGEGVLPSSVAVLMNGDPSNFS